MQSLWKATKSYIFIFEKRKLNVPYIRKAYSILIDTGALSLNTDIISRKSSNVMLSSPEVEDEKTFTIRSLKGFTFNIARFLPLCFIWGMFIYFFVYSLTFSSNFNLILKIPPIPLSFKKFHPFSEINQTIQRSEIILIKNIYDLSKYL